MTIFAVTQDAEQVLGDPLRDPPVGRPVKRSRSREERKDRSNAVSRRSALNVLLMLAGLTGVPALFVPFAHDTTPVAVVLGQGWVSPTYGLPGLLAVLASAATVRFISAGGFSRAERVVAYGVSAASAAMTLWSFGLTYLAENEGEFIFPVAALLMVVLGASLLVRNSRSGLLHEFSPGVALETAYLANAVPCLIGFWGEWQAGAWLVLATSVACAAQMIFMRE